MKKIPAILLIVFAMLETKCAEAQSTFIFQNYKVGLNAFKAPVFDASGNLLSGSRYLTELYGGASPDSLIPLYAYETTILGIQTFGTGKGAGYTTGLGSGSGTMFVSVNTVGTGGFAYLQMVAWDSTLGTTYEAAMAQGVCGYGASDIIYLQGGDPTDNLGFPKPLYGLQSFSLLPVPEPSATAFWLLGIGLAAGLHGKQRKLKT